MTFLQQLVGNFERMYVDPCYKYLLFIEGPEKFPGYNCTINFEYDHLDVTECGYSNKSWEIKPTIELIPRYLNPLYN